MLLSIYLMFCFSLELLIKVKLIKKSCISFCPLWITVISSLRSVSKRMICDVLHNLVPFVQLKKRQKHPSRSVTFSNCSLTKTYTPPWVFLTSLNCTNSAKLRKAFHTIFHIFCFNDDEWSNLTLVKCTLKILQHLLQDFKIFKVSLTILARYTSKG